MNNHISPDRPKISHNAFILIEDGGGLEEELRAKRDALQAGEQVTLSIDMKEITGEFVFFLFQDEQQYRSFFQDVYVKVTVESVVNARVYLVGCREPFDWSTMQAPIYFRCEAMDTSEFYDYGVQQAHDETDEHEDQKSV